MNSQLHYINTELYLDVRPFFAEAPTIYIYTSNYWYWIRDPMFSVKEWDPRVLFSLSFMCCSQPWFSFDLYLTPNTQRYLALCEKIVLSSFSLHLSIHPSVRPSVSPSVHPPVNPSIHPSISCIPYMWRLKVNLQDLVLWFSSSTIWVLGNQTIQVCQAG